MGDKGTFEVTHPLIEGVPLRSIRCLLADPPWDFRGNSKKTPGRNPRRHYDCMSLSEIAALPIREVVADDCILWMWITGPFLAIGAHIKIMKEWGFKPSAMGLVWVKLNPKAPQMLFMIRDLATSTGHTTRKNAEFCLIGKRGKSIRISNSVHEIIMAPRREHSRKPEESYERIERYSTGPRLELFGRQQRRGWMVRGNETRKFSEKRVPSMAIDLIGPDERRRAEIKAFGAVADPGPLFEIGGANHGAAGFGDVPLVRAEVDSLHKQRKAREVASDAGSHHPQDVGRQENGQMLQSMQSSQGQHDSGGVGGVHEKASDILARLRSGLRSMVLPTIAPGDIEQ